MEILVDPHESDGVHKSCVAGPCCPGFSLPSESTFSPSPLLVSFLLLAQTLRDVGLERQCTDHSWY